MCGVRPHESFSNALSTSSRKTVPESDSTSVRLKYSADSSDTVRPAVRPFSAWPLTRQRVRPSSVVRSSKSGNPASSSACRSRRIVRVVTSQSDASSSIVTPAPRARSISRRIVHCRMTSAFRGTPRFYVNALFEGDSAQQIEIRQHLARTEDHRRQRILGELYRKAGLLAQPLVEILQQRPAASEDDAAIEDVGRQLRRNALECVVDRLDNRLHRLGQRAANLLVAHHDGLRTAFAQMTSLHLDRLTLLEGIRRSNVNLDLLGR